MGFKESFVKFAASKAYAPVVALASVGIGTAVGFLSDKFIFSKVEDEENGNDIDDWDEEPEEYDLPDIPDGVNEVEDLKSKMDNETNKLFVKPDLNNYIDYTKYQDLTKNYSTDVPKEEPVEEFIHVIDEEEFVKETGNEDGYVSVTASYFTQEKILAGWNDDLIEREPSETVGEKSLELFDDPSVKAVYVRNDSLKVLYEIVRCDDSYESALMEAAMEPSPDDMR